jgi:hypothetical protein
MPTDFSDVNTISTTAFIEGVGVQAAHREGTEHLGSFVVRGPNATLLRRTEADELTSR